MKLKISDELGLPRDAVTSTFVVYGGKGMGKTNFGSVFAEELSRARLRFAVIDPMGVWWGLRHSADGKAPGVELLILGGVKGDMPIEPSGGAVVADLVADESVNVLIDISRHANGKMWSIGERIRFVRDYFVQLYARQGEQKRPLMQILDEAARFCPQMVRANEPDVAQCLGAVAVMVEEGRNVGVGVCLLTQRSARLNKDVAELADCMIAFRIVGPRSIDAVLDWFGEHIEKSRWKDLIETLRKLPIGRALVVSPGWLEFEGEAQIRRRETFDSSATPKPGEKAKAPRGAAAKPDLGKYQERMAETIERAKASDPKELRKQIAELQRQLAQRPIEKGNTEIKTREVPSGKDLTRLERTIEKFGLIRGREIEYANSFAGELSVLLGQLLKIAERFGSETPRASIARSGPDLRVPGPIQASRASSPAGTAPRSTQLPPSPPTPQSPGRGYASLGSGERRCAIAIAQHPHGVTREQLTVLTGFKRSTRNTYLQRLTAATYVHEDAGRFLVTTAGAEWLGTDYEPLPTGAQLQNYWLQRLPKGESDVLGHVLGRPDGITREQITELTGFKRSTRNTYIQRLAARELVVAAGEVVRPSENLFD